MEDLGVGNNGFQPQGWQRREVWEEFHLGRGVANFVSQHELIPAHHWVGSDTFVRGGRQMCVSSVYREAEVTMQW